MINNLKKYREKKGYTQEAVAVSIGVSQQCIDHWEHGRREPNITKLKKLAKLFGCTIGDLLAEDDSVTAN